jgi:hypothetical protein
MSRGPKLMVREDRLNEVFRSEEEMVQNEGG